MTFHREGIVPFLASCAMYGAWFLRPLYGKWRQKLKAADAQLQRWRFLAVRPAPIRKTEDGKSGIGLFAAAVAGFDKLGFQAAGGYVLHIGTEGAPVARSFAPLAPALEVAPPGSPFKRTNLAVCSVLVHPRLSCRVVVMMHSPVKPAKGQRPRVRMHITSRSGDWNYNTRSGEPGLERLWRSPRVLNTYVGKVSCARLLELHLARREQVARASRLSWEAPLTLAQIIEAEGQSVERIRRFARRQSPLSLLLCQWRLKRDKNREWLGELRGKL